MEIINKKTVLVGLLILNALVLLGQIYPAGAPPFAGVVNLVFLVSSLLYFIIKIKQQNN